MAVIAQKITDRYALYNGDCVEVMKTLPAEKIALSIYSPPFGGLYHYSSSERDLSNCKDYTQFFEHYAFVVRELFRVTMPGRMTAVHCMDVPSGNSGTDYLVDFPGDIIRLHEKEGWRFIARYAIWKEPLAVRNRTMAKNLAHKTIVDDSSRCSVASADYLLVFRRKGQNPVPIKHPHGLMEYAGERKMPAELLPYRGWTGNQIENRYSHWIWRQYASAFWDDIRIGRVLPFKAGRDQDDEKHVHPLQLDVIDRVMVLWSNPGETVLTPFMGVGSEVYGAVCAGRRGIGMELKPSYYRQAILNVESAKVGKGDDSQSGIEFEAEMQSRLQSLIESCVNVAIGYGVALLGQLAVFPLYGMEVSLGVNLQIGLWFTGISIARSYLVRRGFNWWHHVYSPVRVGVDRTSGVSPPSGGAGGRVSR